LSIFLYVGLSSFSNSASLDSSNIVIDKELLLEHLSYLSSNELAGRKIASDGNKLAQKYIIDQLVSHSILPLNKQYKHNFIKNNIFNEITGSNIAAMIPGSHNKDSYIVLSAHFDHIGQKGNKVYNGADDNASGTSALLSLGQELIKAPLKHNVILLFTDGEEVNLTGAKAFVKDHETIISHTKLNINLDMLAGSKKTNKLRYMSRGLNNLLNESHIEKLHELQRSLNIPIKKGFRVKSFTGNRRIKWLRASDHGVFHRAGVPFLYFGVGTHINYHQFSDTYNNVNHDFFHLATNAIYHQLIFIDHNI
jgi:Zn-dependent M28 family amino/carboxypeptidase